MDGNYLIPANTKRGQLIFGLFYPIDLIIFLTGLAITFILLAIVDLNNVVFAVLAIMPGVVAGFLVLPVAYYHNIRQLLVEIFTFGYNKIIGANNYRWKGWCFNNESSYESSNESNKQTTKW